MKLLIIAIFFSLSEAEWTGKLEPPGNLNNLPADITDLFQEAALDAGWYAADQRYSWPVYEQESADYLDKFNLAMSSVTSLAYELISEEAMGYVWNVFFHAAWYCANSRVRYCDDADRDMATVNENIQLIIDSGEMTSDLANNIKSLALDASWYAENSRWLNPDKNGDYDRMITDYNEIVGAFVLTGVKFVDDQGQLLNEDTLIISQQQLQNNVDIPQQMSFKYSVIEGTTQSTSHTLAFDIAINVSFKAGFIFFHLNLGANFAFNAGSTWAQSTYQGTIDTYTYPLIVPAHSTYEAKATVDEGQIEMPYEIDFTVKGVPHTMYGSWKGTGRSSSTYTVNDITE